MQGSRCDLPFFLLLLLLSHPFFPPYLNENIYKGVTDTFFSFWEMDRCCSGGPQPTGRRGLPPLLGFIFSLAQGHLPETPTLVPHLFYCFVHTCFYVLVVLGVDLLSFVLWILILHRRINMYICLVCLSSCKVKFIS